MSPADLVQVMQGIAVGPEGALLVGDDSGDDAAVYRLSAEQALVFTVDLITPLVSDASLFGQIAAANSVSDVYAMGGRPLIALNVCCFPPSVPREELNAVLKGGLAKAAEAGCAVVGGHTVRDEELKYGLAVVGLVHPDRVRRNATARAGDRLVLTKPIGSGIAVSAAKKGRLPEAAFGEICATLARLNRDAMEVSHEVEASAMTDVTGFGLGGHLRAMARASGVGMRLEASRIPAYPGVLDLARAGVKTGMAASNWEVIGPLLTVDPGVPEEAVALLSDPQTSGGLIMAVPAGEAERAVRLLRERGDRDAAIVGEVVDTGGEAGLHLTR